MTLATHFAQPSAPDAELTARETRIRICSENPLAANQSLRVNSDYAGRGWYPVLGSAPNFNSATQYLTRNSNVVDEQNEVINRSWTVNDKTLSAVKAERLLQLNGNFKSSRDAGVYVNGVLLETTPQVQAELTSLVARLTRVGGTQGIATRSGFVGDVNLATATALHNGVENYIAAVWQNDADKTAAIQAATTVQEVLDVDVSAGWPSRNEPE